MFTTVNAKRVETGLPELVIFIVGLVAGSFTSGDGHDARVTSNDDDDAIRFKLSSTSIRAWLASNRGTE